MLVHTDYSLENPDTLTKYKKASEISQKVLEAVKGLCVEGAKILTVCEKGDQLLNDEVAKVYKGKNVSKGKSLPGAQASFSSICSREKVIVLTYTRYRSSHDRVAEFLRHPLHTSRDGS